MSRAQLSDPIWPIILLIASLVLIGVAMPVASGQPDPIYNNTTTTPQNESWMDNRSDPTIDNVSTFIVRVGTFVIGDMEGDPNAGPYLTGLLVGLLIVGLTGATRSGVVGGGVVAVVSAAVLSQAAGAAPGWLYGIVIMLLGLIVGVVYLRIIR